MALTDGPFGVFSFIRRRIERGVVPEWIKTGSGCPVCISFWVGAAVSGVISGTVHQMLINWLVSFGFTCVIVSVSPD
jgi:hypothetical protein